MSSSLDEHLQPGESNSLGHVCYECGEYSSHDELGTYEVLNPMCPYCENPTELDFLKINYVQPEAKNRFNILWKLGYAVNFSKGRKVIRESSFQITFPESGSWKKLCWRFYWKSSNDGYLNSN